MRLTLSVGISGQYGHWYSSVEIPELLYRREFAPLKTCDNFLVALATGELLPQQAATVLVCRKDAADILTKYLSELIVSAMEREDTHNGYKKKPNAG